MLEKQIVDSVQSGTFLEVVQNIYQDNYDEKETVGKEVAALHNAGKIDIITEFRKLNSSDQQHDFFMIRHVLEKTLPSIDATRSLVLYHVYTDPGKIPFGLGWIVDILSKDSVPEVLLQTKERAERVSALLKGQGE